MYVYNPLRGSVWSGSVFEHIRQRCWRLLQLLHLLQLLQLLHLLQLSVFEHIRQRCWRSCCSCSGISSGG
jgi:hypothetical protein